MFFYIKNVRTNNIWKANYDYNEEDKTKYEITFSEDKAKISKTKDNIDTETSVIVAENLGVEIRSIKIKNNSNSEELLEITSVFEPVLSRKEEEIAHPAFNNLFLKYSMSKEGDIIIRRNKRGSSKEMYLACNLFAQNGENQELEFEIDSSKAYKMLEKGIPFSKELGLVTSPCVALKRIIRLKENEEITLNLVISVSENLNQAEENLNYYKVQENIRREFNISRAKAEEEVRYLSLSTKNLTTCQSIIPYIMYQNPLKSLYLKELPKIEYKQSEFWKYGISGDLPIMLVLIRSVNDVSVVKEMLKVHEYLRVKGVQTDLVILDYEKNIYEQYVKEQIIQEILNMQIGYLQNISGGIFLLNSNEIEDEDLFKLRANIIIYANKGSVLESIKEMEEEYKVNIREISKENLSIQTMPEFEKIKPGFIMEELKYYNGYGGFSEGRKRIYHKNKQARPITSTME